MAGQRPSFRNFLSKIGQYSVSQSIWVTLAQAIAHLTDTQEVRGLNLCKAKIYLNNIVIRKRRKIEKQEQQQQHEQLNCCKQKVEAFTLANNLGPVV